MESATFHLMYHLLRGHSDIFLYFFLVFQKRVLEECQFQRFNLFQMHLRVLSVLSWVSNIFPWRPIFILGVQYLCWLSNICNVYPIFVLGVQYLSWVSNMSEVSLTSWEDCRMSARGLFIGEYFCPAQNEAIPLTAFLITPFFLASKFTFGI